MPDRSRFTKNTLYQYGLQAAKYLFPFITIAYLTRTLGADVYAIRAYVIATMSFMLVFLDFGFLPYGTGAIARAEDDIDEQNRQMSSIVILRTIICIIGAFAIAIMTVSIPLLAANPLYVAIAYIGTCLKVLLPDFVFQGRQDMGIITTRFVATQIIAVALIFLLIHGPSDLLLIPLIETLATAVGLIWSWANVFTKQGLSFVSIGTKKLLHVFKSASVFFVADASIALFSSLTTILIGIFITDQVQISYWSVAMTAIVAVQALYSPLANSLYPHMVRSRDFALLKRLLLTGTPCAIVGAILLAVLSKFVMLVLGGPEFVDGSYVLALLAPMLAFSYPAVMLGYPVLAAVGRARQLTAVSVGAALFHIAGLGILAATGSFTIFSVAILRCCTEALLMLGRAFFVWRYHIESNRTRSTNA